MAMYGKLFESTYKGSLVGSGADVFAVWTYIIAHTKEDHFVEVNPRLLAMTIGMTPERCRTAIDFLCATDAESRSKEEDGRRLIREGEYLYRVVNHAKYRGLNNDTERRQHERERKAAWRAKQAAKPHVVTGYVPDSPGLVPVLSISTDTDTDTEAVRQDHACPNVPSQDMYRSDPKIPNAEPPEFQHLRQIYPRRAGSQPWRRAFAAARARLADGSCWSELLAGVERYALFVRGKGDEGTAFVMMAATFLGPERHYLEPWTAPLTKAETRRDSNAEAGARFLAGESEGVLT